jgi:hypothetical protein
MEAQSPNKLGMGGGLEVETESGHQVLDVPHHLRLKFLCSGFG